MMVVKMVCFRAAMKEHIAAVWMVEVKVDRQAAMKERKMDTQKDLRMEH
jgi:hypothetical protein